MGKPRGAWADKAFRDALRIAVNEDGPDGVKKLRSIAVKLVDCAVEGKLDAIREVADRLDGRPAQDINVDANVSHELASLTDRELADRIQRELASIAGRSSETKDQGKLH